MAQMKPSSVTIGRGPAVICFHSSTSSSKQWHKLTERLAHAYQIVAPDLYGYGESPAWGPEKTLSLQDELELVNPILNSIGGPFHVIGHSYGAAVAITIAMTYPMRVRSLVLYEPVLFNLLFEANDQSSAALEINAVRDDVRMLVEKGALRGAGSRFVNYWSGEKVWEALKEWQKDAIARRMSKVVADFDATIGHNVPLAAYRDLDIPTLLLYGLNSPSSTQAIMQHLGAVLPKAEVRGLLGLGHMGPITHAEQVLGLIVKFIELQPKGILVHQLRRSRNAR